MNKGTGSKDSSWKETPSSDLFKEAHRNSDRDQGDQALHHTIGKGPFQAARGKDLQDLIKKVALFGSYWSSYAPGGQLIGAAVTDVTDLDLDVLVNSETDVFMVIGIFSASNTGGVDNTLSGQLDVNGNVESREIKVQTGPNTRRGNGTQIWFITGLEPGSKTFKLKGYVSTANNWTINMASGLHILRVKA